MSLWITLIVVLTQDKTPGILNMPKRKEPERSREEQAKAFKEAAKKSGADLSGRPFEEAMKKIAATGKAAAPKKAERK